MKKMKRLCVVAWRRIDCADTRGASMVEAAIYLPMVILCIMFTIYMMLNMYTSCVSQSDLHIKVRREADKKTAVAAVEINEASGKNRYEAAAESSKTEMSDGSKFAAAFKEGRRTSKGEGGRMIKTTWKEPQYGRWYVINEKLIVGLVYAGKDIVTGS
jgi:hypothetical protein